MDLGFVGGMEPERGDGFIFKKISLLCQAVELVMMFENQALQYVFFLGVRPSMGSRYKQLCPYRL